MDEGSTTTTMAGRGGDIRFQPGRAVIATGGAPINFIPRGGDIIFSRCDGTDALRIAHDGGILVNGAPVANDREAYVAFRGWLTEACMARIENDGADGLDIVIYREK